MPFSSPCVARGGGPTGRLLPRPSAEGGEAVTVTEDIAKVRISSSSSSCYSSSSSSNFGKDKQPQQETQQSSQQGEGCRRNLCNIGDDCLSAVLSFLAPSEIVACAGVCRHLRDFCKDDHKLWLPMCERRWGAQTSVQKWGRGRVLFKVLYANLMKMENLVGFWRGVGHGGHGSLVTFEWGPHYVVGHRVTPSRPSCYEVCKIPFAWVGVSDTGSQVCLFDPDRTITPFFCEGMCSSHEHSNEESPVKSRKGDPFSELDPDWDLEHQSLPSGLIAVDLHFVGKLHIVMEELQQPQFLGNRSLAEAAVVASFGSRGGSIAEAVGSLSPSSPGSSSEMDRYGQSPPGSFHYEMYQFLASKVTSQGGERIVRKQRRRERERALQGRRTCEPEHFVKVRDVGPTAARPLQGLWKGISDSKGLDFVLLSYDDKGGIVCRRVGECLGTTHSGSVCWTAESDSTIRVPLAVHEQHGFDDRQHFAPTGVNGKYHIQDGCDEEVVGMLCTLPITGLDFRAARSDAENIEGRVWLYASGRFGFGFLPTNFIIDFRPICSTSGVLLDVLK